MKKASSFLFALALLICFVGPAKADQLIGFYIGSDHFVYDSYANITWYDYTHALDTLNNQQLWASTLVVDGTGPWAVPTYDLLSALRVLIRNPVVQPGGDPFLNLQETSGWYWTGTQYGSPNLYWAVDFYGVDPWHYPATDLFYGMVLHAGDLRGAPVPASVLLLVSGLIPLAWARRKKRFGR